MSRMLPADFGTLVQQLRSMGLDVLSSDPMTATIVVRVPDLKEQE